jgi:hypothetical protein
MNNKTCFENVTQLTRDEKREIWLKRNSQTLQGLAVAAGVSKGRLSIVLRGETMPPAIHARLVEYGVPEELLPPPLDIPPGPKPRMSAAG